MHWKPEPEETEKELKRKALNYGPPYYQFMRPFPQNLREEVDSYFIKKDDGTSCYQELEKHYQKSFDSKEDFFQALKTFMENHRKVKLLKRIEEESPKDLTTSKIRVEDVD